MSHKLAVLEVPDMIVVLTLYQQIEKVVLWAQYKFMFLKIKNFSKQYVLSTPIHR